MHIIRVIDKKNKREFLEVPKILYKNDQPTGGVGFFECINDKKAASLLFDTARDWLKTKGMEAAEWVIKKPGYRYEHFVWERLEEQLSDFVEV